MPREITPSRERQARPPMIGVPKRIDQEQRRCQRAVFPLSTSSFAAARTPRGIVRPSICLAPPTRAGLLDSRGTPPAARHRVHRRARLRTPHPHRAVSSPAWGCLPQRPGSRPPPRTACHPAGRDAPDKPAGDHPVSDPPPRHKALHRLDRRNICRGRSRADSRRPRSRRLRRCPGPACRRRGPQEDAGTSPITPAFEQEEIAPAHHVHKDQLMGTLCDDAITPSHRAEFPAARTPDFPGYLSRSPDGRLGGPAVGPASRTRGSSFLSRRGGFVPVRSSRECPQPVTVPRGRRSTGRRATVPRPARVPCPCEAARRRTWPPLSYGSAMMDP